VAQKDAIRDQPAHRSASRTRSGPCTAVWAEPEDEASEADAGVLDPAGLPEDASFTREMLAGIEPRKNEEQG
ncbi:MAG: hypothetical protein AAF235_10625, partial [Planctomycetota bacterium]